MLSLELGSHWAIRRSSNFVELCFRVCPSLWGKSSYLLQGVSVVQKNTRQVHLLLAQGQFWAFRWHLNRQDQSLVRTTRYRIMMPTSSQSQPRQPSISSTNQHNSNHYKTQPYSQKYYIKNIQINKKKTKAKTDKQTNRHTYKQTNKVTIRDLSSVARITIYPNSMSPFFRLFPFHNL